MFDPKSNALPLRRGLSSSSVQQNKQKDLRNSISSATLCTTKLWHATLQTLPLPIPTRNRISLQEQQQDQQQQENNTIGNLFRRLTRNSTLKKNNNRSNTIKEERPTWICKKGNDIFLKSPYVVAGGELKGTVVIKTSERILSGFQSLCVKLIGIEVVADPNNPSQIIQNYQFLKTQHILVDQTTLSTFLKDNKINVPFVIPLQSQLGGTFHDRKGSVKYYLESEITHSVSENAEEAPSKYVVATRIVTMYSNCVLRSLSDVHLYTQQSQSVQIWRHFSTNQCVSVDASIPRAIWVAGASIYVTLKIQASRNHSVSDIKLELIRRQHTFSDSTLMENSTTIPLTSTREIVAQVALSKTDWWQPLHGETDDQMVITLKSPNEQVTIRNQKLIEVSYTINVLLACPETTTAIAEFPITLVHPISMDPPPGNYAASKAENGSSHLFLQDNFQRKKVEEENKDKKHTEEEEEEAKEDALDSPTASFLPLDMETCSIVKSPYDSNPHSCSNSYFADTEGSRISSYISNNIFEEHSIHSIDTSSSSMNRPKKSRNPLNKMHRSLSDWGNHVSRKMLSSHHPKQQQQQQQQQHYYRDYLSPDRVHSERVPTSSRSSFLSVTPSSICSSITDDRSSERFFLRCSNRMMRFGQVQGGPKQFGQQPNCVGDASSDMRRYVDILHQGGLSAEMVAEQQQQHTLGFENLHVEDHEDCYHYGDDEDTDIDGTQELMKRRKSYQNSFTSLNSLNSRSHQEYEINSMDVPENDYKPRYPLSHTNSGTKRMLASSRYLKSMQRKSMQHKSMQPITNDNTSDRFRNQK